jgi:site-specific recombinase XerD
MEIKRLTKEEVEEFREEILQSQSGNAKRNYAIVTIMAYAGLRVSEIIELKKTDVDVDNSQMFVTSPKYNTQSHVEMESCIVSAIEAYQASDDVESAYLFHDSNGDKMTMHEVKSIFAKSAHGNRPIRPHMLRDFFLNQ